MQNKLDWNKSKRTDKYIFRLIDSKFDFFEIHCKLFIQFLFMTPDKKKKEVIVNYYFFLHLVLRYSKFFMD